MAAVSAVWRADRDSNASFAVMEVTVREEPRHGSGPEAWQQEKTPLKMKDFRNFVLRNCILVFDADQVYLKLQVINLKNKEVTVNRKTQTLEKKWFFEYPIPYTLNPKPLASSLLLEFQP